MLLIVAALQFDLLRDLLEEARELGMECIVEVHDASELASAARLPVDIIGINNRDLRTFDTDLQTTVRLAGLAPSGPVLLSESGIHTCGDIELLLRHGIHAVLIGESLMRAADPGEALAALLSDVGRNAP